MTTSRVATAWPNMPVPTGSRIERTQSRLRLLRIPASWAKRRCPVSGSSEVDHRPVRLEEPRDLGDGRDQLVVDLAVPAVGIVAPMAVGRGAPPARARRRPARDRGAGRLVARAWSGWPRPEDTPRPRRTGMAVRRWRLRHPADARPDAGGRPGGRASATTSCPPPTVREWPAAVTMPPDSRQPRRSTTTSRTYARCSLPAPRSAPPTWPSARSSWRWRWARPTSTRRWVACCSPSTRSATSPPPSPWSSRSRSPSASAGSSAWASSATRRRRSSAGPSQGPYYSTAYIAKAIEVALIVAVSVDFARHDGNPVNVIRRELAAFGSFVADRRGTAGAGA